MSDNAWYPDSGASHYLTNSSTLLCDSAPYNGPVHSELQALLKNNTWSLYPLPNNRRAVGCKWLFKVDVNNPFLNGDLTEEIYVEQPPSFEVPDVDGQQLVCHIEVVCYSDADWASSVDDRSFTTGYIMYLRPNPITWCSKKQNVVSRSSYEVEYRSLANFLSELLWVKQLINEIGLSNCPPPMIWCNNTSTVSIAVNPTHHARMKHVEIDHQFVREKVLDDTLQVNFVPSSAQVADVITKPITPKQFESFRQALRVLTLNDALNCSNSKETGRMLE
ncbi:hypothetical protein PVK06_010961 [Gossypium arboreum]|uniref:Uncharacterized protein n=1 Tax=Gossypium arboreum TaxID=29729 RepID=A0ABR0Q7U3_GOSAR|nr:hypothetical protein PVK06_010961 [Gossypium arboreum]